MGIENKDCMYEATQNYGYGEIYSYKFHGTERQARAFAQLCANGSFETTVLGRLDFAEGGEVEDVIIGEFERSPLYDVLSDRWDTATGDRGDFDWFLKNQPEWIAHVEEIMKEMKA